MKKLLQKMALYTCLCLSSVILSEKGAWAGLDGSMTDMMRDSAHLSADTSGLMPWPVSSPDKTTPEQSVNALHEMGLYVEYTSFLHKFKVREYLRAWPPEKVFAVYWDNLPHPAFLLPAQAKKAYKQALAGGTKVKTGPYIVYSNRKKTRFFVVDTRLAPKNFSPSFSPVNGATP